MIIGNGQLAKSFNEAFHQDALIYASGVANSNCQDPFEFKREKHLLMSNLNLHSDLKFVYFSSSALSSSEYSRNAYYEHKLQMEEMIKSHSNSFYIFRIPQLFGALKHHNTLINFIYESIVNEVPFKVFNNAYRYVIEIEDVRRLVEAYLKYHDSCITVDLANPYRYKVTQIVELFENILNKKAVYELVEKDDQYTLDLSVMSQFVNDFRIDIDFGEEYLAKKLELKIKSIT